MHGAPPPELIAARLASKPPSTSWFGAVSAVCAGLGSLLPVLTCPACWPAYAGVLGALGVSFLNYTPYLLPAIGMMLGLTLASLGMGARRRHGYGPLVIGMVSIVALVAGRFVISADSVVYVGLVVLLSAAVWNAWPTPTTASIECSSCSD